MNRVKHPKPIAAKGKQRGHKKTKAKVHPHQQRQITTITTTTTNTPHYNTPSTLPAFTKPLIFKRKFATKNDDEDTDDFEFDELPTIQRTTTAQQYEQQQQQLQQQQEALKKQAAMDKSQQHHPTTTSHVPPQGFVKDTSQLGNQNLDVVGTTTMQLKQDGSLSRKTGKQPKMTLGANSEESYIIHSDGEDVLHAEVVGEDGEGEEDENINAFEDEQSAHMKKIIERKTPLTPLCNEMRQQIVVRGPLSVAEYMQFCLGHPQYGYYMQRNAIGKKGDFVTSPEISPLFSEMIGIWGVSTWMRMGRPEKLQIVELGPGRGTLMKDFLATAERFPEFYNAISVHFVENSGAMRKLQRQALGVELDLEFMAEHPGNSDTFINALNVQKYLVQVSDENAQSTKINVNELLREDISAQRLAEQEKKQEAVLNKMRSIMSQSTTLKEQIEANVKDIQKATGELDSTKIDLKQLRPELLEKLKSLEQSFAHELNKANNLSPDALQSLDMFQNAMMQTAATNNNNNNNNNNDMNNVKQNKEQFLESFMKLSTGQFSSKDFQKLYSKLDSNGNALSTHDVPYTLRNVDCDDDEEGWIWGEKPSKVQQDEISALHNEEQQLQSELLLSLPRVIIPSHLTPEQQQQRVEQHQQQLESLLQKDPQLNDRVNTISQRLEQIQHRVEEIKQEALHTKTFHPDAKKYNRFMNLPIVCGLSSTKFDPQRTKPPHQQDQHQKHLDNELELNNIATTTANKIKKVGTQLDKLKGELPVSWHWTLHDVPSTAPCLILAHEFFDALPVHQFQFTQRGWREILVDADETLDGRHHFRYVLAPTPTPASISFLQPTLLQPELDKEGNPMNRSILQHQDDHQHNNQALKTQQAAQDALSTPGSQIAKSAKIAESLNKNDTPVAPGVILGADGLPLNQKKKTIIQGEITAQPLSEALSTLSNPAVTPDDVKNLTSLRAGTDHILGADNEALGDTKLTSVSDELIIRDLDARFKRNKARGGKNSTTDPAEADYNHMHGIDRDFEHDMSKGKNMDLQNSPFIRQKLLQQKNQIGDTFETSPASLIWSEQIALRLMKNGGAALLIDYGDNDLGHLTPNDFEKDTVNAYGVDTRARAFRELSLQGIKSHQHADVLEEPGLVDLSAHVNFAALGAAMKKTEQLTNMLLSRPEDTKDFNRALDMLKIDKTTAQQFNPRKLNVTRAITQSALLQQLGLEDRFETLLRNCTSEQEQMVLFDSVNRLVDPQQMGELFKAMAVYTDMQRPPVGWDTHITTKEYEAQATYGERQRQEQIERNREEDDAALEEYQQRNKMLNTMQYQDQHGGAADEYEERLLRAAATAGRDYEFSSSLIGGPTGEVGQLNALTGQGVTDATAALEKLREDKSKIVDKDYYVVDRNKYTGRD